MGIISSYVHRNYAIYIGYNAIRIDHDNGKDQTYEDLRLRHINNKQCVLNCFRYNGVR